MRIGRFAFGECSSLTLPPEADDAISPLSPLRPPRKSFAFALRTAALPPGRRIGTRECSNVKPLRLRDTALAALDGVCSNYAAAHRYRFATHSFNGWRCCPIPPLYKVLVRQRLLAPFSTASKRYTIIGFYPTLRCTRIIRLAAERICRQWNTSANILRYALHGGQRHSSTSSDRSGSEQEIVPTP